jgi:hypothetical protein
MKPVVSFVGALLVLSTVVFVGGASAEPAAATPTFAKDIAPILQRSCQVCHRAGSIAPMSLLTYEQVRPWARAIKQRTEVREMPPWYVERNVGIQRFKGDRSLSDGEILTIAAWADAGAPLGDPADMPPPATFTDVNQWFIGEPDLIVELPKPFVVKPEAADWWGNFVADPGLTEDRYIKAVEAKPGPGSFQVVHHLVTTLLQEAEDGDLNGETLLQEYALGKNGDIFPDGTGRLMKAGAKIRFNMHYHSIGEEIVDRSRVGIKFYPKGYVPKHFLVAAHTADNDDLDIPPGQSEIRHDGYHPALTQAARITAFQPHLHNRGKRQCLEAIYPTGRTEMLSCAKWDFGWHIAYTYEDDAAPLVPKGTVLHQITWHDNSPANRWNPDPRNWAGFGQRSIDDMSFTWVSYYYLSDEEYEQEVKARTATNNQNQP